MIYTEEQWEMIKQASPHYETAKHEYIRNAPRWLTEQVIRAYEAATGKTVPHKDLSCAVCVLRIYQVVGSTYFSDLKEREEQKIQGNKDEKADGTPECGDHKKKERDTSKNKKGSKQIKDKRVAKRTV